MVKNTHSVLPPAIPTWNRELRSEKNLLDRGLTFYLEAIAITSSESAREHATWRPLELHLNALQLVNEDLAMMRGVMDP